MRKSGIVTIVAMCAFTLVACSNASEETPAEEVTADEVRTTVDQSEAATASGEAFEVCDGDGNRYPSEADAEAAGLSRAEYGATYCEYLE